LQRTKSIGINNINNVKMETTKKFLDSLVFNWLSGANPKLAGKFQKEAKAEPLPPGSPSLQEMVEHFKANTPQKRKAEAAVTNGKAKKAKQVSDHI
jgi:hypothetical protein